MTQEEKHLLIKDLSARLPYGVIFNYGNYDGCDYKVEIISPEFINNSFPIENCKQYLRPMCSMTKEEDNEYINTMWDAVDWLNAHHFDYRGLIRMGLALEAPEGMYKTE